MVHKQISSVSRLLWRLFGEVAAGVVVASAGSTASVFAQYKYCSV